MKSFYWTTIVSVTESDPKSNTLKFKVRGGDNLISEIDTDGIDWGFVRPYSSAMDRAEIDSIFQMLKFGDHTITNTSSGTINYPRVGDFLVISVFVYRPNRATYYVQGKQRPLLILGYLAMDHPEDNLVDNIILDRSGAKIHFNHIWNDDTNMIDLKDTDGNSIGKVPNYQGHTTILGNRMSILSGQNFLPFGLLSHKFSNLDPDIQFESGFDENDSNSRKWSELFTRDLVANKFYVSDLSKTRQQVDFSSERLLEPPAPPLRSMMQMHESGWKNLVYANGNVHQFMRSRMKIIGGSRFPYSFAPDGKESFGAPLSTALDSAEVIVQEEVETQLDSQDLEYAINADETITTGRELNKEGDGLEATLRKGISIIIPTTDKTGIKAVQDEIALAANKPEPNKIKIMIGGTKPLSLIFDANVGTYTLVVGGAKPVSLTFNGEAGTIVLDAPSGVTWTGDLNIIGKLTVSQLAKLDGGIDVEGDATISGTTTHGA